MFEFNVSRLPSKIANVLLLRGSTLTPLRWLDRPNQAAKDILDRASEETALFDAKSLADESMCAAVRAMLYLFSGWRGECDMFAQASPVRERAYLTALSLRQAGQPHEAKEALQQFETHPIYPSLAAFAIKAIGPGANPALVRFKQIVELGEAWEPFAFIDLYEQARAGKLTSAPTTTVREMQYREFELLFTHCYEAATGAALPKEPAATTAPRRRVRKPQRPASLSPIPNKPNRPAPQGRAEPALPRVPHKPGTAGFSCPKCNQVHILPEQQRGTKHQCSKCGVTFLLPKKPTSAAPRR